MMGQRPAGVKGGDELGQTSGSKSATAGRKDLTHHVAPSKSTIFFTFFAICQRILEGKGS